MQAEDIIQQKEWRQLSAEEKTLLQPLVVDEQEFNLLKKMLTIVNETAEIPQISPAIQSRAAQFLKTGNKKIIPLKLWHYAAAAAIILIMFMAWLFVNRPGSKNNDYVKVVPDNKPIFSKPAVQPDSILQKKEAKRYVVKKNHTAPAQNHFATITTLVAADSSLMALVTEVY